MTQTASGTRPQHRVLLISTGGTFAGHAAGRPGRRSAPLKELEASIASTLQHLGDRLDLDISLDENQVCDRDSSDIGPAIWAELAGIVKREFDEYDSFVITHGTNTLGYTSAALTFALPNVGKPVVLTGSQVPAGLPGSDALMNLQNALRVAVWRGPAALHGVQGVVAVFGSKVLPGSRVKKATEFDYDALETFSGDSIGAIGRYLRIDEAALLRQRRHLQSGRYPLARHSGELVLENNFDMSIASLTEFPGMSAQLIIDLVERERLRGVILRSFGAGDPSEQLMPAFEFLREREVPIVFTTQAPRGVSNFQVNESGRRLFEAGLAIPAFDMSIEAQTTKLAWLLAKRAAGSLTYSGVCEQMVQDYHGEITVEWEFQI